MENNWKEKAEKIFKSEFNLGVEPTENELTLDWEYIWKATEKCMNLVFEATKKECADKANVSKENLKNGTKYSAYMVGDLEFNYKVDKESILNIKTPNL